MKRILIVEDDPNLRTVIRLVVERAGYEVREARHGVEALESIGESVPDVIVADMRMPLMTGAELIRRIRSDSAIATIPIVLLTGLQEHPAELRLADAVVAKPFEPADLVSTLDRVLLAARKASAGGQG